MLELSRFTQYKQSNVLFFDDKVFTSNSRKNKNKNKIVVVPFIFRQDRKILAELYMQTTRFGEYKQSEVQI